MSIQGELSISLSQQDLTNGLSSKITSSRPLEAAQLFSGKTIDQTLQTLPLLFNICAQAQAVTTVRAIESALQLPVANDVESQREALIIIESLREHCLQILMKWPEHIDEALNNEALSDVVRSLNKLIQLFKPTQIVNCGANGGDISTQQSTLWNHCATQLSNIIFGLPVENWQQDDHSAIKFWASQKKTQAARFIHWLEQQDWKYAGNSNIKPLPEICDSKLVEKLVTEQESFTSQPDWQSSCYETSWFNNQQDAPVVKQLEQNVGKGIYTRMVARLIEVTSLIKKLHQFFRAEIILNRLNTTVDGLAHSDAARGRLSHYVQLEDGIVKRLLILAPTEWNFHKRGVAADSLSNLHGSTSLQRQADLLIHAIDPCVGYQLRINTRLYTDA